MNTIRPENNFAAATGYVPSPAIWEGVRINDALENPGVGIYFYDNFIEFPLIGTQTTQIGFSKYKVFNTGAGTVSRVSAVNSAEIQGGALTITLDTDNDSGSLAQAYPSFRMSGDKADAGPLYFEICYAQNSIVTNLASVFFGLFETEQWTLATGVPLNGGDAITNAASGLGFRLEEDGLGVVDTVYTDRATSFTNIGDADSSVAANTFAKFGFVYDPEKTSDCVTFFKDNQKLTNRLSRTTLTGTTNLKANALGFMIAACADSAGTSFANYVRWVRIFQYFPGER